MIVFIALTLVLCAYFLAAFFLERPRRTERGYLFAAANFAGAAVFLAGIEYGWRWFVTLPGLALVMLPSDAVRQKARAFVGALRRTARSAS